MNMLKNVKSNKVSQTVNNNNVVKLVLPSITDSEFFEKFQEYYTCLENKNSSTKKNTMAKIKNEAFKMIDKGQWCECSITKILREFPNISSIL